MECGVVEDVSGVVLFIVVEVGDEFVLVLRSCSVSDLPEILEWRTPASPHLLHLLSGGGGVPRALPPRPNKKTVDVVVQSRSGRLTQSLAADGLSWLEQLAACGFAAAGDGITGVQQARQQHTELRV